MGPRWDLLGRCRYLLLRQLRGIPLWASQVPGGLTLNRGRRRSPELLRFPRGISQPLCPQVLGRDRAWWLGYDAGAR